MEDAGGKSLLWTSASKEDIHNFVEGAKDSSHRHIFIDREEEEKVLVLFFVNHDVESEQT